MQPLEEQIFTKVWVPTLTSFTNWALQKARGNGVKRLYFLARDAYYPYLIANHIQRKEKLDVEIRYLEGSRYAFRMAEFGMPDSDPIEKICIGGVHVTLRSILRRGGLTDAEISEVARVLQKESELDKTLCYEETVQYKTVLKNCDTLLRYIRKHGEEALLVTKEYLRQEGFMDDVPIAICDSGWVGSLQETLSHLSGRRMDGYYFGLYELPKGVDANRYHTFYFRPYLDIKRKAGFSNCLFECVCSSEKGMTIGYQQSGETGQIYPVYETKWNQNAEALKEQEALLRRELKHLGFLPELDAKEVEKILYRFMSFPTKEESKIYGKRLFSDDVLNHQFQTLSEELTAEEQKNLHPFRRLLIMKGLQKGKIKDSAWPEGSVSISTSNPRQGLRDIRNYKKWIYLRKRMKRRGQ